MSPKEFTKANNEGDDIFLCEYEYDMHWHSFKRLAEINNGEEVRILDNRSSILRIIVFSSSLWAYYLIFQGNEEADNGVDWDYGKDSGSDTEEDMEYEEENVNNLPSGPSPAHAVAAVWTLYILFISVAFSLVVTWRRELINYVNNAEFMEGKDLWAKQNWDKENSRACEMPQADWTWKSKSNTSVGNFAQVSTLQD